MDSEPGLILNLEGSKTTNLQSNKKWKITGNRNDLDVLVRWHKDRSENVVSVRDLQVVGGGKLKKNASVEMWWEPDKQWWKGVVLETLNNDGNSSIRSSSEDDIPLSEMTGENKEVSHSSSSSSMLQRIMSTPESAANENITEPTPESSDNDDDVPLATLKQSFTHSAKQNAGSDIESDVESLGLTDCNSDRDPDYKYSGSDAGSGSDVEDEEDGRLQHCEHLGCSGEVLAACAAQTCLALLCFNHFDESDSCFNHGKPIRPISTPNKEGRDLQSIANLSSPQSVPEQFEVDGMPRQSSGSTPKKRKRSAKKEARELAKRNRNLGVEYLSSGGKLVQGRHVEPRCTSSACERRSLRCMQISEDQRNLILESYNSSGDLMMQRMWIASHVVPTEMKQAKKESRKGRTLKYFLPDSNNVKQPACMVMFLNTLGVTARQVRTALKSTSQGTTNPTETRGGRRKSQRERDRRIHQLVTDHIGMFPRMESHYCRQNTSQQYLSPDLTVAKMHDMFVSENPDENVSYEFYLKVIRSQKLKFHVPKKDLCGLCDSYRRGSPEEKQRLSERYHTHIREKEKSRILKKREKERAQQNPTIVAAHFDLEQVLFLPASKRCELFYKRRLSNYNFTLYDLGSNDGFCYLWHEGVAGRGSNEIASNVHHFLKSCDEKDVREVCLFADGCTGQNKNSILPAMILYFIHEEAKSVERVTLYYFETNHGHFEGDSIHSTVERALRQAGEVFTPSQLYVVVKLARRKKPYHAHQVMTTEILDWKQYSQDIKVLRNRVSDEGNEIDWKKVMQIQIDRQFPNKIRYKSSHTSEEFFQPACSRWSSGFHRVIQKTTPCVHKSSKIAEAKYADLMTFINGSTPVITHPDHVAFYKELPH